MDAIRGWCSYPVSKMRISFSNWILIFGIIRIVLEGTDIFDAKVGKKSAVNP